MRYMLLRLSVNMYVFCDWYFVAGEGNEYSVEFRA